MMSGQWNPEWDRKTQIHRTNCSMNMAMVDCSMNMAMVVGL